MEGHLRRADEARGVNLSSFTFETHSNLARKLGLNLGLIAVLLSLGSCAVRRYLFIRRYFRANGSNLRPFDVKFD
ncbi:hypothetical protein [Campylobacter showae]